MQLFIHLPTNLELFELLNDGFLLSTKDDKTIASFFMNNFKGEIAENISPQYDINFSSIRELKKKFGKEVFSKIDGIYYGSDNCEYLVPTEEEIKIAYEKFIEFNKLFPAHKTRIFTLVTSYLGDEMLKKLEKTLDFLNNLKSKSQIEVVFNDYGTLSLLTKKYKNLKPVIGRLLHKTLKTPLVDTYGYDLHPSGESIKNKTTQEIDNIKSQILKNQSKFYASSELSNEFFNKFVEKYGIENIGIDYLEKREDLYNKTNYGEKNLDIYYPWSIVFTGRLCDTCGIENPGKGMYATDYICPRVCKNYDINYGIKTVGYNLIQRGNSGFKSQTNLDYLNLEQTKEEYRLVFAPFITV